MSKKENKGTSSHLTLTFRKEEKQNTVTHSQDDQDEGKPNSTIRKKHKFKKYLKNGKRLFFTRI